MLFRSVRCAPKRYCPARNPPQAFASSPFSVIVIARSGQMFSHWRQPIQSPSRTGVDFSRSLSSRTDLGQTPIQREHPLHHALLIPTLNCFFPAKDNTPPRVQKRHGKTRANARPVTAVLEKSLERDPDGTRSPRSTFLQIFKKSNLQKIQSSKNLKIFKRPIYRRTAVRV